MSPEATVADKVSEGSINSNQGMAVVQSGLLFSLHLQYLTCFLKRIKRARVDETHLIANYSPLPFCLQVILFSKM